MKFSRNQIAAILIYNVILFLGAVLAVIKWIGVSNIRFYASLASSLVLLFFVALIIKTHYKLLFK